jgi:hypothetical protein
MSFSDEISEHVTTFSEVENTRRCFVGDLSGLGENGEWMGDEVIAETTHGRVKVRFVDEVRLESARGRGFLGRVFGF